MASHAPNGNAIAEAITTAVNVTCKDRSVISTRSESSVTTSHSAAFNPSKISFMAVVRLVLSAKVQPDRFAAKRFMRLAHIQSGIIVSFGLRSMRSFSFVWLSQIGTNCPSRTAFLSRQGLVQTWRAMISAKESSLLLRSVSGTATRKWSAFCTRSGGLAFGDTLMSSCRDTHFARQIIQLIKRNKCAFGANDLCRAILSGTNGFCRRPALQHLRKIGSVE